MRSLRFSTGPAAPALDTLSLTTLFRSVGRPGASICALETRAVVGPSRWRRMDGLPVQLRRLGRPRRDEADPPRERHAARSEEHTSELQSLRHLVCRLLLEKKDRARDRQ